MTEETMNKFRTLFEEEKDKLLYSKNYLNEEMNLKRDDLMDEVDQTSAELETAMRIRLRNREGLFLKKINAALERIENGIFGACEDCEEPIELKRLLARPTTTLCLACKEGQEHREKSHIDGHRSKSLGRVLRFA